MKIQGFVRPNGGVGIRNYLLVMAVTRGAHYIATTISDLIRDARCFVPQDEDGKGAVDRLTLQRIFVGLGSNSNVGAVLLVCNGVDQGYPELKPREIAAKIAKSGKPVEILSIDEQGGIYQSLGEGVRMGRELSLHVSRERRREVSVKGMTLSVKCGLSDATSGICGNPVVGSFFDTFIDAGGTVLFSETTEVIGAEHILAKRCRTSEIRKKFLETVQRVEDMAKATGEDIRSINPIPANIEAGITTLEEKSLGAIIKAGTRPIEEVLAYGERPERPGLYFMDSWMSSTSLFLGYAAAGSILNIFQLGGMVLPVHPVLPAMATGIVAPVFYSTGNPRTYERSGGELDFNAGPVISGEITLGEAAKHLEERICDVAGGTLTKTETLNYQDQPLVYFIGPDL